MSGFLCRSVAPVVVEVFKPQPAAGDPDGGTWVEIRVDSAVGATAAHVGGVALTSFEILDGVTVGGFTGAHSASATPVDVTVTSRGGTGTLSAAFTYRYTSDVWSQTA